MALTVECPLPVESAGWVQVQTELRTLRATVRTESDLTDAMRRWRSVLVSTPCPPSAALCPIVGTQRVC
jgi:hypothetical protein